MKISMIAAMTVNRVIGKDNQMPWHLPEDLKHFKASTMGKPIVMGRKTFESIGRPLPGRHNIVITRQSDFSVEGITAVSSFEEAKSAAGNVEEIAVIGGGQLYKQLLPIADKLYLTLINIDVDGDTYFPDWDDGSWQQECCENGTSSDGIEYSFINYVKKC
ncbi:type 3 dihydrofolate reductase [Shewanella sp. 202IG2-18]|uniref:type 3 dihydrofolate reductase n=1 Tax=Parashewanella hymeniacidonis TaxID=2807618 RepID=UPI001960CF83|nr:type 3 dihydrofolate reductase [Parashewanella hymeniacidonis]MBM7070447.1 type 3 dihydrofolate reductase [Parashewanella hymeniacidonis]